jgi:flagellar hook protein FlgE
MIGSLQTGVSGLQRFQEDLEVIGNNIANVNTTGYKSASMQFADTFSQTFGNNGSGSTMQIGTGVASSSVDSEFTQGDFNTTGIPTNLAINGEGFFIVKDSANGVNFATRDGGFKRSDDGFLVSTTGYRVQGYTGPAPYTSSSPIGDLQISDASAIAALNNTTDPAPTLSDWSIDSKGQINASLSDGSTGVIGQVVLQNFSNPQALQKQGNNLFFYTAAAGPMTAPLAPTTAGLGLIKAGSLESSNVDLASQMAAMITAQRAFEANAKIVTTSDEVLQTLVNLKR